jgi:DNA (cytosine-5)-methyltransferase 1
MAGIGYSVVNGVRPWRVLDLFAGIGGFSLGLERAGMQPAAFCEIDPYCQRVLAKHWPGVKCYPDVRQLSAQHLAADGIAVDVICGGFPCQDLSLAGAGAGLAGDRSGLWREYARLVGELRPRFVIVENVAALLGRGLGDVLGDLAALGYDAEWHCIPAAAVGAPHRRDRIWIVAHANGQPRRQRRAGDAPEGTRGRHADRGGIGQDVADAMCDGSQGAESAAPTTAVRRRSSDASIADVADAHGAGLEVVFDGIAGQLAAAIRACSWPPEPDVGRMAFGVPARVDRLRGLGNALVPQIAELIGRALVAHPPPWMRASCSGISSRTLARCAASRSCRS